MRFSNRVNDVVRLPSPIASATLRHWKSRSPTPRVDVLGVDRVGVVRGDVFDVDAAFRARDHDDPLRVPVDARATR